MAAFVGGSLYGGERFATVMWPEVSANVWLAVSLGCGLAAMLILYRKHVLALVSGTGLAAPASLIQPEVLGTVMKIAVFVCFLGGLAYGITTCVLSRVDMVWVHPTLLAAEQERTKAECRMRAAEEIQGGAIKDMDRLKYKQDCLLTEGFRWVEEPPATSDHERGE